jgi:cyclopropane fatty-acyl-phospholipid synthase-like methyltransferase
MRPLFLIRDLFKIRDTNSIRYYNSVFKRKNTRFDSFNNWGKPVYLKIIDFLRDNKIESGKLIDLGCGSGLFLSILQQKNDFNVTAIDFSKEALNRLNERKIKNVKVDRYHLNELTKFFTESIFDLATSIGTHEHVNNYMDSIKQVHTILKQSGLFIIALPTASDPKNDWFNDSHQTWWRNSEEKWLNDLISCGFQITHRDKVADHVIFYLRKI